MKKTKKLLSILLVAVMCLGLAACGKSSDKSDSKKSEDTNSESADDISIGVVLKATSTEYFGYIQAGAEAAGKELGVKVDVIGPAQETLVDEQNNQIENYISSGKYDALAITPIAPDSVGTVIGDSDIPVVFMDTDAECTNKVTFVGTGNYDAAKLGAKYCVDNYSGEIKNVVIIGGQQGNTTCDARMDGFTDGFKEAGYDIAASQYADSVADKAAEKMENILTSLNNDVSIVCCMGDEMAAACAKVIEQAGVKGVMILGFDGIQTGIENIISETMTATVAQSPYQMGYIGVESAIKAVKGEGVEKAIDSGCEIVDKKNAEPYLADLKKMLGE